MRVVHVTSAPFGLEGLFGGGERYPLELARALAAEVDCSLVTFGHGRYTEAHDGDLRIRTVRSLGWVRGHPAHPIPLGLSRAIGDADVVHTHQLRSLPSIVAALEARAKGRRLAVTDHGLGRGWWGGALLPLHQAVLAVSRFSATELRAAPNQTHIIHGGVDPDRFAPDPTERRAGVLFVGRITPHKGIDVLLRALPGEATLTIAGSEGHDPDPPERHYPMLVRRLAASRDVTFAGPVLEEELPKLYRRAAVVALPSVHRTIFGRHHPIAELLGLVALEAMASGTPVVASRVGGLPEVVLDGETGFLVPPGDAAALRDRLSRLLGDRTLAETMGRAGRELVLERFTWKAVAERCLRAYEELLGAG